MTRTSYLLRIATGAALAAAAPFASAQYVYETVPLGELEFAARETVPLDEDSITGWSLLSWPHVWAEIEGEGEVYVHQPFLEQWDNRRMSLGELELSVRALKGEPVRGTLYVYDGGDERASRHTFQLAMDGADTEGRAEFLESKYVHYTWLHRHELPGSAWFRHRANEALAELEELGESVEFDPSRNFRARGRRIGDVQDSYDLFTGGRALSENLQLDRVLAPVGADKDWTPIDEIRGIETEAIDWAPLVEGLEPELDPLASFVPTDQHVVFFPSFGSMVAVLDEARENGTPVLELFESASEDALTKERYERQMCLGLSPLSRLLGDRMVATVAMTGSDPYLRTGSDVAILFQARDADGLVAYLRARQTASRDEFEAAELSGEVGGLAYSGVMTGDEVIQSLVARSGDVVLVTNSFFQLERFAEVTSGREEPLATLDEYVFFRDRYRRGEDGEDAFVVLTDATIRRWCSPKWRIGASRRTRAAAYMVDRLAENLDEYASGTVTPRELDDSMPVTGGGALHLTRRGVVSDTYGSLDYLTPIAELEIENVTENERLAYDNFRRRYQNNWQQFFDPIAVRISVEEEELGLDVSVIPLIEGTDYRELIELTTGVALGATSGDPHSDALLHFVMSIDKESRMFREIEGFANILGSRLTSPLSWVGESLAIYADEDPIWAEIAEAENWERAAEDRLYQLPVAVRIEVTDPIRFAAFMAAVRAFVDSSAPDLMQWENRTHGDRSYVAILPDRRGHLGSEEFAIYYATLPDSLVISLNEGVVQRAMERGTRGDTDEPGDAAPKPDPWLGESVALRASEGVTEMLKALVAENNDDALRDRAWRQLPVLNEWRRRYPGVDPVDFHERFWGIRLVCPGGGEFVWNEEWQTMESTVFGHPGGPKPGSGLPPALERVRSGDFGVTFEQDGLRARARIRRSAD